MMWPALHWWVCGGGVSISIISILGSPTRQPHHYNEVARRSNLHARPHVMLLPRSPRVPVHPRSRPRAVALPQPRQRSCEGLAHCKLHNVRGGRCGGGVRGGDGGGPGCWRGCQQWGGRLLHHGLHAGSVQAVGEWVVEEKARRERGPGPSARTSAVNSSDSTAARRHAASSMLLPSATRCACTLWCSGPLVSSSSSLGCRTT